MQRVQSDEFRESFSRTALELKEKEAASKAKFDKEEKRLATEKAASKEKFATEISRRLTGGVPTALICPVSRVAFDQGDGVVFSPRTQVAVLKSAASSVQGSRARQDSESKDHVDSSKTFQDITKQVRELFNLCNARIEALEKQHAYEVREMKSHLKGEELDFEFDEKTMEELEVECDEVKARLEIFTKRGKHQEEIARLKAQNLEHQKKLAHPPVEQKIQRSPLKEEFLKAVSSNNVNEVHNILTLKNNKFDIDLSTIREALAMIEEMKKQGDLRNFDTMIFALKSYCSDLDQTELRNSLSEFKAKLSSTNGRLEEKLKRKEESKAKFEEEVSQIIQKLVAFEEGGEGKAVFSSKTGCILSKTKFEEMFSAEGCIKATCPVTQRETESQDYVEASVALDTILRQVRELLEIYKNRLAEMEKEHQIEMGLIKEKHKREQAEEKDHIKRSSDFTIACMQARHEDAIEELKAEFAQIQAKLQSLSPAGSREPASSPVELKRPFSSPEAEGPKRPSSSSPDGLAVTSPYLQTLRSVNSFHRMNPHFFVLQRQSLPQAASMGQSSSADPKRPSSSPADLGRQSSPPAGEGKGSVKEQFLRLVSLSPDKVLEFFEKNKFEIDLDTTRKALEICTSLGGSIFVRHCCYKDIIGPLRTHERFLVEQQKILNQISLG